MRKNVDTRILSFSNKNTLRPRDVYQSLSQKRRIASDPPSAAMTSLLRVNGNAQTEMCNVSVIRDFICGGEAACSMEWNLMHRCNKYCFVFFSLSPHPLCFSLSLSLQVSPSFVVKPSFEVLDVP